MHLIRWIHSYILLLKASACQGRRQFETVIELALKAKSLDPCSLTAFLFLGDDYHRLKRYHDAQQILQEALTIYPTNPQFNQLMVMTLLDSGEPVESAIPYIRAYLTSRNPQKGKFPGWMPVVTKLVGKKIDWDAYGEYLYQQSNTWAQWAQDIIDRYEHTVSERNHSDKDTNH